MQGLCQRGLQYGVSVVYHLLLDGGTSGFRHISSFSGIFEGLCSHFETKVDLTRLSDEAPLSAL